MVVASNVARAEFNGNGSTTTYNFAYPFFLKADINIQKVIVSTGVVTTMVLDTDYTIPTASSYPSGATITFTTAPASGIRMIITRSLTRTQEVVYTASTAFPASSHEKALDRLVMMVQEIFENLKRIPKISFSAAVSTLTAIELPVPVDGKIPAWSGTAGKMVNSDITTAGLDAAVTAAAASATAAAASATATATSATASATSATAAATSATASAASASTASTQATNAATSATNSATSATASAASAASAVTTANNLASTLTGNYVLPSNPSVDGANLFSVTSQMKADMEANDIAVLPTTGVDVTYQAWLRNGTASSWLSQNCSIRSLTIQIEGLGTGTFPIDHVDGGELKVSYSVAKNKYVLEKVGKAATL